MTVSPTAGVAPLNVGAAPQQPASLHAVLAGGANLGGAVIDSSNYGMPTIPGIGSAVAAATGPAPTTPAPVTGGGDQATQGAAAVNQEQLIGALQNVISAVTALVTALQAQGGVTGGGAPGGGTVGQCGMPGCTMDHGATDAAAGAAGANGAPQAAPQADARQGAKKTKKQQAAGASGAGTAPSGNAGQAPQSYSGRTPKKLPGETSYSGLNSKSFKLLEAAHEHGLKLISGHRPGDSGSGHSNGSAVDVANVPGGSRQGSPEMRAYAEAIRAAGKAGDPNVGYVIYQQQIASSKNGWAWRDMEDRGSNTQNHFDHVHVSSDPSL